LHRVCIATHARLHLVCIASIATHARQVCKGLQAASDLRAYRVCIAANARRRRV
jgi:hypothetical protein